MGKEIRIRVLLFAMLAEVAGWREKEMTLPPGTTAGEAVAEIVGRHGGAATLPTDRILLAVNERYAEPDVELKDGDELALIPPVSGGAGAELPEEDGIDGSGEAEAVDETDGSEEAEVVDETDGSGEAEAVDEIDGSDGSDGSDEAASADGRFAVTAAPLNPAAAAAFVGGPDKGAVCTFVGTVRGVTRAADGVQHTEYLFYEAYAAMAVAEMARIAAEAARRWPDVDVAMHHRIGRVDVGEAAVVVAVAAPHRDNAFAACRFGIDELKRRCPIWKKEVYADGREEWVGPEADGGDRVAAADGSSTAAGSNTAEVHRRQAAGTAARCSVVTVSDSRTAKDDRAGALLQQRLSAAGHAVVVRRIVADEEDQIEEALRAALEGDVDCVFFTGGTGISARDRTPDVVAAAFDRTLPGFGELFRSLSYGQVGAAALLSRAVAGVVGRTAVFCLPGSPAAVQLALDKLVLPELPHLVAELNR